MDECERLCGPALRAQEPPGWRAMRMRQIEGWSGEAKGGVARVMAVRPDLATRVIDTLYIMDSGPAWVEAWFEGVQWLTARFGDGFVDGVLEGIRGVDAVALIQRLKESRKLAKMAVRKVRVVSRERWLTYGVALLPAAVLVGWLRAEGVSEAEIEACRDAWANWIIARPVQAGTALLGGMRSTSRTVAEVMELVPDDVAAWTIKCWRKGNELRTL